MSESRGARHAPTESSPPSSPAELSTLAEASAAEASVGEASVGGSSVGGSSVGGSDVAESSAAGSDVAGSDVPEPDVAEFAASIEQDENRLWEHSRLLWWATLVGPVLATCGLLGTIYLLEGAEFTRRLIVTAITGLFLFGRFIILAGHDPEVAQVTGRLTSFQLFLMVTYLDVVVAVVLTHHVGFLFRLPWFGSRAKAFVNDGRFLIRSNPWLRRMTFLGLVLFVAIPLAAMGSVGGTILGRMLALTRRRIFFAILIGSLLGNGVMWLGSDLINRFVDKHHPVVRFGGLVLILLVIATIETVYRRATRRTEDA